MTTSYPVYNISTTSNVPRRTARLNNSYMDIPPIIIDSYRGHRVHLHHSPPAARYDSRQNYVSRGQKVYLPFCHILPTHTFSASLPAQVHLPYSNGHRERPIRTTPLLRGPPIAPDARCGWGSALSALLTSSLLGFSLLWQTYVNMVVYYTNRRTGALQV